MSAWIEPIPLESGQPSPGPAKEIQVMADTYEEGKAQLIARLPDGWRMMNIGVDR
ncbi:hypothetical protein ACFT2C_04470 [Promicromonospora sp. NPDC057138]|uniref:hypothetical protein n=1 Tax=Promicromonospora sp. NPDC057138 TaxID=3346031 RepID=UPI00363168AB